MRLPMKGGEVDTVEFSRMVDTFLENGFNLSGSDSPQLCCANKLYLNVVEMIQ